MKIGSKIRRLRKLRGLTIEELANGAELTKGFISQLERDMTMPSVLNLKQVLEVLGLDLATFFSDMEEREKNIYTQKDRIDAEVGESYRISSLVPKLKYLEMEPKLITLAPLAL
ncbi:MAG: helix-turn-helix transcriptional regulator, partial [Calditrichaeota bacterium]|nr:helix-turn-helix transcriptional regulator [Calditrichota bacterium]